MTLSTIEAIKCGSIYFNRANISIISNASLYFAYKRAYYFWVCCCILQLRICWRHTKTHQWHKNGVIKKCIEFWGAAFSTEPVIFCTFVTRVQCLCHLSVWLLHLEVISRRVGSPKKEKSPNTKLQARYLAFISHRIPHEARGRPRGRSAS